MSITDELRDWAKSLYTPNSGELKLQAERIADRIDAELAERYVALPLDAYGVPIRVSDEMVCINNGEHCPVEYIVLTEDGWEVDGESPASMRHYHTPTVEDVLYELTNRLFDDDESATDKELIAEYAAKLRLAGEDE